MLGELLLGIKKSPAGTSSGENPGEGVSDTDSKNRLLQALIVRVEERDLLHEAIKMVDGWFSKITELHESYTPPDAEVGGT